MGIDGIWQELKYELVVVEGFLIGVVCCWLGATWAARWVGPASAPILADDVVMDCFRGSVRFGVGCSCLRMVCDLRSGCVRSVPGRRAFS